VYYTSHASHNGGEQGERQMTKYEIAASSNGVMHSASSYMGSQIMARCNGRSGMALRSVKIEKVAALNAKHFCSKCFPNGKPDAETLAKYA